MFNQAVVREIEKRAAAHFGPAFYRDIDSLGCPVEIRNKILAKRARMFGVEFTPEPIVNDEAARLARVNALLGTV